MKEHFALHLGNAILHSENTILHLENAFGNRYGSLLGYIVPRLKAPPRLASKNLKSQTISAKSQWIRIFSVKKSLPPQSKSEKITMELIP